MTPPLLRLCTCGHRFNRHSELDKQIRGECLLCSCSFFEDAKSGIEEEIAAPQPYEAVLAAAALPDSSLLGSWDSWWCESCGARRFKAGSCHGLMRPVRVEIHARQP